NKLQEINNLISKQSNIKPSLIIGNVTFVNHPYIPSGVVVDQEPKPGKLLYKDSEINFLVSLGRFKRSFKSQNYTGRFVEQVIKDLEEKNIFCNIKNVKGDNKSDGKIVYQSVKPGNDLHPGDVIELHVVNYNLGEIQKNYKIIKFIVPSIYDNKINEKSSNPSLNRVSVKLVVKDLNGETVIYEGLNNPNDKIIECYKVIGIGILKVYLDDKQYSSYKIE
ncbi:MAG: PASTA domain-containing protein, partial [Spirochaetota bacterium]|nr:PASTA domain-containing protein [Spirochaetota bacterium]